MEWEPSNPLPPQSSPFWDFNAPGQTLDIPYLKRLPPDVMRMTLKNLPVQQLENLSKTHEFKQIILGDPTLSMRVAARQLNIPIRGNEESEELRKILDLQNEFEEFLNKYYTVDVEKNLVNLEENTIYEEISQISDNLNALMAKAKTLLEPDHPFIRNWQGQISAFDNIKFSGPKSDALMPIIYPLALKKFPPGSFILGISNEKFYRYYFLCIKTIDSNIYYEDYMQTALTSKVTQFRLEYDHLMKNRITTMHDAAENDNIYSLKKKYGPNLSKAELIKKVWEMPLEYAEFSLEKRDPIVEQVWRSFSENKNLRADKKEYFCEDEGPFKEFSQYLVEIDEVKNQVTITNECKNTPIPRRRGPMGQNSNYESVYRIILDGKDAERFITHWKNESKVVEKG